jgi:hypothetical protein
MRPGKLMEGFCRAVPLEAIGFGIRPPRFDMSHLSNITTRSVTSAEYVKIPLSDVKWRFLRNHLLTLWRLLRE